jgi:hypothetical protein
MSSDRGPKRPPNTLIKVLSCGPEPQDMEVGNLPYLMEVAISGKVKEVTKKYSARYGKKGIPRSGNCNPSPDDVKAQNEKNAIKKLRRKLNANFGFNDMHLVLTYRPKNRPDPEHAKIIFAKFLRELRKLYRNNGQELKYICVTEYKNKAIHHHLIINSFDMRLITPLWPYGKARPTYLDETGQYGRLAEYFVKETKKTYSEETAVFRKRWNSSRNLKEPDVKTVVVNRNSWTKAPKATKGYFLEKDSVYSGVSSVTGYPFQFYSMVRLDDHKYVRKRE